MNTLVSFEIAKLLKEKSINIWSEYRYTDFNGVERLEKDASEIFPYAPTIAEVVMWLYEKYGIWISVEATDDFTMFCFRVRKKEISRLSFNYNSPTEAYSAAIEYTLNNLI